MATGMRDGVFLYLQPQHCQLLGFVANPAFWSYNVHTEIKKALLTAQF